MLPDYNGILKTTKILIHNKCFNPLENVLQRTASANVTTWTETSRLKMNFFICGQENCTVMIIQHDLSFKNGLKMKKM